MSNEKTLIVKNMEEKSVLVSRNFAAPIDKIWRAYTEKELLDQWWGPAPWQAETQSMNFTVGGFWHYAMVGPENERHYGRMDYTAIETHKYFNIEDGFCDAEGALQPDMPVSKGAIVFTENNAETLVEFKMTFDTEEALKQIIEMGFEQGITKSLDQLEELLNTNKI